MHVECGQSIILKTALKQAMKKGRFFLWSGLAAIGVLTAGMAWPQALKTLRICLKTGCLRLTCSDEMA
jgi:hypothetical protein